MRKGSRFIKLTLIAILLSFFISIYFYCSSNIFAGDQIWTSNGPINGSEMDLAIGTNSIYASGYNGVWKSENKGFSWIEKNNGIPTPYDVNNIEVDFNNENVVFAGTWNQGLYKSENGGNNWIKLNSFPGNYIRKLKIDPSNGDILYVGTGSTNQPGTIYKTIDGGNTWQELNLGVKGIIAYITIEPANTQAITAGIINTTNPGRYRSEDGGITWIKFSNESNIDFPDYPTPNPQVYYKITNNKLYISLNKGISWSPTLNNNLPNNFQIRYLTIDNYSYNRIFLFSVQYGAYESNDAGYSWNSINNGLFDGFNLSLFQDMYIDRNNPSTLYITTKGKGVWQYTTNLSSPTPTPTPTPLQPIVLIPGLGASWNHENMILGVDKPQSEWFMTPGVKIYDSLIETLKNVGYKTEGEDKNLFIFNYNWTKPINLVSEDLKNYIQNVVKLFPETKIDLIGHSLGGLVARTYIQSNQNNPVDQLLTLGSPLKGAPSVYYPWEGGDLSKSLSGWQRIGAGLLLHLRKPGFSTTKEAVRNVIPSLRDLLPTFNYLKENSQEKSLEQMSEKNDWLINLNHFLPNHLTSIANNFVGILPNSTIRWINVIPPNWLDKILGLWSDGKPQSDELSEGDYTVLKESASLHDSNIINLEDIGHQELVTSLKGQQKIMEILGLTPKLISTISANLDYETALVFQVASPATIEIFDEEANPIGLGDGKLMIVPNAQPGKYKTELTGTAQGNYTLYIGQITENNDVWTTISGSIDEGNKIDYFINFNLSSPLEKPVVDESGETYFETAHIELLNLKKELESQNFPPFLKKIILAKLKQTEFLLNKYKIEKAIISLYNLRNFLSLWQKINILDANNLIYLKNKIQTIINNLEEIYIISENTKDRSYNQHQLKAEIKLAQKSFEIMENRLQKLSQKNIIDPELGSLYLLAQGKLNNAKKSISFESHINALGVQSLSQEALFLIGGR